MLVCAFCLTTLALFLQALFFPHFTLLPYSPWLTLLIFKTPHLRALIAAALTGGFVDLLSNDPFGSHALNAVLTVALLHRFGKFFSWGLSFGLFTSFLSLISTLLHLFLLFLFDRRISFAGKWVLGDLLLMPLVDGIYAMVWVAGPLTLLQTLYRKEVWKHIFSTGVKSLMKFMPKLKTKFNP